MKKQRSNQELMWHIKNLEPTIEKTVSSLGFSLVNISFVNENGANYLRITIMHPEHPVFLDDCELVSKKIEKELDNKNLISFSYLLEVQSPGIEKELTQKHEFVLEKLGLTIKI